LRHKHCLLKRRRFELGAVPWLLLALSLLSGACGDDDEMVPSPSATISSPPTVSASPSPSPIPTAEPTVSPTPAATASAAVFSDPFEYCSYVGTIDEPDGRWVGPPTPDPVVAAFSAGRYDPALTVWRCMGGQVWACNLGVNLPCGKAETSREPTPAMTDFCRHNPDSTIPFSTTGHANIWNWQCDFGNPKIFRSNVQRGCSGVYP